MHLTKMKAIGILVGVFGLPLILLYSFGQEAPRELPVEIFRMVGDWLLYPSYAYGFADNIGMLFMFLAAECAYLLWRFYRSMQMLSLTLQTKA